MAQKLLSIEKQTQRWRNNVSLLAATVHNFPNRKDEKNVIATLDKFYFLY